MFRDHVTLVSGEKTREKSGDELPPVKSNPSIPITPTMQRLDNTNLNLDELIKNLTHNFNVVADELETSNRQIHVLTQKLRFSLTQV